MGSLKWLGVDLSRANLSGAYFADCNVSWVCFAGANLSGAYFCYTNLSGADLSKAKLIGADLTGANLSDANVAWLRYERRGLRSKCFGIRVAKCFGHAVFKRDAEDQGCIDTLGFELGDKRRLLDIEA